MKVIIDDTYKNRPTRIYENESPCLRAERQIKVAEDCVEYGKLGGGKWNKMHDISRRVYSPDGVSPTIHTAQGGNTEPKVVEHMILDEQNGYIRQDGCVGTLTTDRSSPKHNNRVIEKTIVAQRGRNPDNSSNRNKGIHLEQRLEENTEGIANTLSTVQKDNYVCEKGIEVVGNYSPSGHDASRIVHQTVSTQSNNLATKIKEPMTYRIRKLTPRECFRLMGFDDIDFDRAAAVCSSTNLYKQAGNSIVVDVLEKIFQNLFS